MEPNQQNNVSEKNPPSGAEREKLIRKKIQEIQADTSLTPAQKAREMQAVMSGNFMVQAPVTTPSTHVPTEQELAPTYRTISEDEKVLGCQHYIRNCKKRAACCGKFYTCRVCHDQAESHQINRHDTQEMLCMFCGTIQPCGQVCSNPICGKQMALYYCPICKFWDNDPKRAENVYHCTGCRICRVGPKENFVHCDTCGACLLPNHVCSPNKLTGNCPICHEDLFSSREPTTWTRCNHGMHVRCFRKYGKRNFLCPLCSKTLLEDDDCAEIWASVQAQIDGHPMPEDFKHTKANILCNDCEKKSTVPYHFSGHKCAFCPSFNTRIISTLHFPTFNALGEIIPPPVPQQPTPESAASEQSSSTSSASTSSASTTTSSGSITSASSAPSATSSSNSFVEEAPNQDHQQQQ